MSNVKLQPLLPRYELIAQCLEKIGHARTEHVREAVLRYLNGEGRIDDLLLD